MSLDRMVGAVLLSTAAAALLLVLVRDVPRHFARWRHGGVGGLDIVSDDLDYFTDPELRTPELEVIDAEQLTNEPLDDRMFWGDFVAPSRPVLLRGGLIAWGGDGWRGFGAALLEGEVAEQPVPLALIRREMDVLADRATILRPAEVVVPLGRALQRVRQHPCDGQIEGWCCAVEGAVLATPLPATLEQKQADADGISGLSARLSDLEPPCATLLQRRNTSLWLTGAGHKAPLQFNSAEMFLVQVPTQGNIHTINQFTSGVGHIIWHL